MCVARHSDRRVSPTSAVAQASAPLGLCARSARLRARAVRRPFRPPWAVVSCVTWLRLVGRGQPKCRTVSGTAGAAPARANCPAFATSVFRDASPPRRPVDRPVRADAAGVAGALVLVGAAAPPHTVPTRPVSVLEASPAMYVAPFDRSVLCNLSPHRPSSPAITARESPSVAIVPKAGLGLHSVSLLGARWKRVDRRWAIRGLQGVGAVGGGLDGGRHRLQARTTPSGAWLAEQEHAQVDACPRTNRVGHHAAAHHAVASLEASASSTRDVADAPWSPARVSRAGRGVARAVLDLRAQRLTGAGLSARLSHAHRPGVR